MANLMTLSGAFMVATSFLGSSLALWASTESGISALKVFVESWISPLKGLILLPILIGGVMIIASDFIRK